MHKCGTLSKKETEQVNKCVRQVLVPSGENAKAGQKRGATRGTYAGCYTPEERAKIGQYAVESVLEGLLGTSQ